MTSPKEQLEATCAAPAEKQEITSPSFLEKVALVESTYIGYPRLEELLSKIGFCQRISTVTADPECMFIGGDTGAGKSTLCDQYMSNYPKKILPTRTHGCVLRLSIPTRATHHSLVEAMLEALGDKFPTNGTTHRKTMRLRNLLRDCGVELIILDELQLFYDKDANKVLKDTCDWLRGLIVDTKIPVVLLGLPEAEAVLNANEQLSRRFANRHKLTPLTFSDDKDMDELSTFLLMVEKELPLRERSGLNSYDMAYRIRYATDGVVGYIMTLIRKGFRIALEAGVEKIDLDILEEAFDLYIQKDKPTKTNPFRYVKFTKAEVERLLKEETETKEDPGGISKKLNARKRKHKKAKDIF